MVSDEQIHEAFTADADKARVPTDLLDRIKRDLDRPAPWWHRLRGQSRWLEVALVACVLIVALPILASLRGTHRPGGNGFTQSPAPATNLDSVARVYRVEPGPGGRKRDADLQDPEDRQQIARLLEAIAAAEPVDPAGADSYHPRARVGGLLVELRDGRRVSVRPAMYCQAAQDDGVSCRTVPGKQVISVGENPDGKVVASSALESLLQASEWPRAATLRFSLDDVAHIRLEGFIGFPPESGRPPEALDASDPADRPTMAKVVGWIRTARVVDGATAGKPQRVTRLVVELKDGRSLTFQPAVDCTSEQWSDGSATHCTGAVGELFLDPGAGQAQLRLLAPELAGWLRAGWERDLDRQTR